MNQIGDPFATYDAAYVLGALSPEDRAAFEEHLGTCDACARSVRELAGMPGLLAQVEAPEHPAPQPPPAELLPTLLGTVRKRRRRRLVVGVSAAVAAVASVAAAAAIAFAVLLPGDSPPAGNPMTPLGAFPVQASASLTETAWGSSVDLSCSYRDGGDSGSFGGGDYGADGVSYVLVAVRHDGTVRELASWRAFPDSTATMTVGTALHPDEIRYLEIRSPGGPALLRLSVTG